MMTLARYHQIIGDLYAAGWIPAHTPPAIGRQVIYLRHPTEGDSLPDRWVGGILTTPLVFRVGTKEIHMAAYEGPARRDREAY